MQSIRKLILLLCLGLTPYFALTSNSYGQDDSQNTEETAGTDATVEGEKVPSGVNVLQMFKQGGWAMYPLMLLSTCGVGLIIYNFLMIREQPFLRPDIVSQMKPLMGELRVEEAKDLCYENPSVITNIISSGLERVDGDHIDPESVKEAMEESSTEELSSPFVMINYLSIIGNLSPMVGLLGTVSGMIKAFRNIAAGGVQAQLLADNISEALITTASGLIVAIPAMFFYFFFKNKYGKISAGVSKLAGDTFYEMIKGLRRHAG